MFPYLEILRPANGMMSAFSVYIASAIAGAPFGLPVVLAIISVFLISGAGMVINDYFDVEIDRVNKPQRPIPSGKINRGTAAAFAAVLFSVGIVMAFLINIHAFIAAAAASSALILYAWRLKRVILIGHLTVSAMVAMTFIYGSLVNLNYAPVIFLAMLAFLSNTGREIYKSIEDVLGDEKAGIETLPIKYGVIKARVAASLFIFAAMMLSFLPYFLGALGEVYLFFVVLADIIFLGATVLPVKYSSKLCKAAMFAALVAFFAGSIAQPVIFS